MQLLQRLCPSNGLKTYPCGNGLFRFRDVARALLQLRALANTRCPLPGAIRKTESTLTRETGASRKKRELCIKIRRRRSIPIRSRTGSGRNGQALELQAQVEGGSTLLTAGSVNTTSARYRVLSRAADSGGPACKQRLPPHLAASRCILTISEPAASIRNIIQGR